MKSLVVTILFILSFATALFAQEVQLQKQHNMKMWNIPAGNYSGITHIKDDRYALVSDKQETDGWTEVRISFLPSGDIEIMQFIAHQYNLQTSVGARDSEGIAFVQGKGLFVAAENDQQILGLSEDGTPNGKSLSIPHQFSSSETFPNYGFESLTYNKEKDIFWTTTEQGLKSDVSSPSSPDNPTPTLLRLLSFDSDMKPLHQYAYKTDAPLTKRNPRYYAFGVSDMLVINDTTLLVMERELNIPKRYNRAKCNIRIYSVNPQNHQPISETSKSLRDMDSSAFLPKTLVCTFSTGFRIFGKKNLANYEGLCLGPKLDDNSQIVMLVADSQSRAGNSLFHLKDYIRTLKIN